MNLLTTKKSVLFGCRIVGRCLLNSSWTVVDFVLLFSGVTNTNLTYDCKISFRPDSQIMCTKLINTRMMFNPTSSLLVATSRVKSWLSNVGRNVISVVNWMACKAFSILQVSLSAGVADGFVSSSRSAWVNKLCKCWSRVCTVEKRLKPMAKMGFWQSIHVTSGPEFCNS